MKRKILSNKFIIAAFCFSVVPLLIFGSIIFSAKPELKEHIAYGNIVLGKKGDILKIGLSEYHKYSIYTPLSRVAPAAIQCAIDYEDKHFFRHPGINPLSMMRAFAGWLMGGRKIGASTLTMQVARLKYNLITSSLMGKLRQIWIALLLEWHYDKNTILETYFNLAPYGGNIEGIEAAARIYFNKAAANLTLQECKALTIIPQNPIARHPLKGKNFNLARSLTHSDISPLSLRSLNKLPFKSPHLSMELISGDKHGRIQTGIESDLQAMLETNIRAFTETGKRYKIENAAAIVLDTDTMLVSALAGSADFFNSAIDGQVDGSKARRSPGSTLKPFIYALGLDQGLIHPQSMLPDSPRSFSGYDPENFDKGFRGPICAAEALSTSRNLPAIYLAERLRAPNLYDFLQMAGISFPKPSSYYGLSLVLGGAEISMRELAGLYAILANAGLWRPLQIVKGASILPPRRLISPESAKIVLDMLEREDEHISSKSHTLPLYYKTGTSNGLRDAWTAGLVGRYVLVVWVGNFSGQPHPLFIGAKSALPLFRHIANSISSMRDIGKCLTMRLENLNIDTAPVCKSTGDFTVEKCAETVKTQFIPGVSPTKDSGIIRSVLIDKNTGKRACIKNPASNDEIWWEFWPSHMLDIFADAGIYKPKPPEWLEECKAQLHAPIGKKPEIILPKTNIVYHQRLQDKNFFIPLKASADGEVTQIHWFADKSYIASSRPGETVFWRNPPRGKISIQAIDDNGRMQKQNLQINALP